MALGGRKASGGEAGASQSAPTPAAQGGPACPRLPFSAAGMGMCLPCLGGATEDVVETPDPDTRRRQLAEAAEKRQKENVHRGVKNPESVERKKKKQETLEKQQMNSTSAGGGGLRWQVG